MSHLITLVFVVLLFIFGPVELESWISNRGDKNTQNGFLVFTVLLLLGLLLSCACNCYCVDNDDTDNDHHDHGSGTSNDHVIVNITELASVDPSVLIR